MLPRQVAGNQRGRHQSEQIGIAHRGEVGRAEEKEQQPIHQARPAPLPHQHGHGAEQQQIEQRWRPQRRLLPLVERADQAALLVGQQDVEAEESVGVEKRRRHTDGGHQPEAPFAGLGLASPAPPQGVRAISSQHHETHEKPAVAVGPEQKQRRQQPHPAPVFQNQDGGGDQHVRDLVRAVGTEIRCDEAGDEGRRQGAIEALRAAPGPEPHQGAEGGHQQGAQEHHAAETAGGVGQVDDGLPQPRVRQVEGAHGFLAGQRLAQVGGETERIGYRNLVVLDHVLAGFQVQPSIGVSHFGGEAGHQKNCRERHNRRPEPVRQSCWGAGWHERETQFYQGCGGLICRRRIGVLPSGFPERLRCIGK